MRRIYTPDSTGWLAAGLAAVAALVLVWSVVRLGWLLLDGPRTPAVAPLTVPDLQRVAGGAYAQSWDLFGTDHRAPLVMPREVATSPLALRLRGVVAGDPRSYAIIADADGAEAVYRPGDTLASGATVEAIEARRVLIRRDGQVEALELQRETLAGGTRREAQPPPATPGAAVIPGLRGVQDGSGASIASVESAVRGLGVDTQALAASINVQAVPGGGFRVRPGRDARIFRELGLHAGDEVIAVNGQPLRGEADVQRIFEQVMASGDLAITVRRDGREQVLRPDLGRLQP